MKTQRYDLLYFGVAEKEDARELAALGLARLLAIEVPQAEAVLNRPNVILRQQLLEEEAKALQAALFRIGIRSNYQPASRGAHQFELVPLEEEKARAESLVCPNCGAEITAEPGEALPEVCPSCDIVFAKYAQYTQEQKQRERLRQRLLAKMKAEEAEAREEAERIARLALERHVEDEVRRELGLPSVINSRARVAGAAGGLLLAGLLVGLGAAQLAGRFGEEPPAEAAPGIAVSEAATPGAEITFQADPGAELVAAMQGDASVDLEASLAAAGAQGGLVDPLVHGATGLPAAAVNVDPALPQAVGGIPGGGDKTGRRAEVRRTAVDPALVRAVMIGDATVASDPVEALGGLALHFKAIRQPNKAAAVVAEMQQRADGLSAGLPAAKALGTLAYVQSVLGDSDAAERRFDQGLALAGQLKGGAERGLAFAALAAQAARGVRPGDADALFRRANGELVAIRDLSTRLLALCGIAESYALAGRRGTALSVLELVTRQAATVTDARSKSDVWQRLAQAQSALDDLSGAWETVRRIPGVPARDSTLYGVTRTALNRDYLTWGMELAGRLDTPRYAAMGQAWVGLARVSEQLDGSAELARAEARARQIADPAEQADVFGQLGQIQWLSGDRPKAAEFIAEALRAAGQLPVPDTRDRVFAGLAERYAGSLMSDEAAAVAAHIQDVQIKASVEQTVAGARRLAAIVLPAPPAAAGTAAR